MSKWETIECDVCERLRKPRLEGIQWLEVYWIEKRDVVLHTCGDCRYVMERLLLSLGFQVEMPCAVGPNLKRIDRVNISWMKGEATNEV